MRAGLFMVACDIPAARKVCGFTSHSSVRACYKCDRKFTVSEDSHRVEYSGFDVSTWVPSTCAKNCESASLWKAARTKAEQDHISREYGVRWSMLQELPYFDIPKCTVIDPMHNLFLGTAKQMTDQWMKSGRTQIFAVSALSLSHFIFNKYCSCRIWQYPNTDTQNVNPVPH